MVGFFSPVTFFVITPDLHHANPCQWYIRRVAIQPTVSLKMLVYKVVKQKPLKIENPV
jgi:hypothetical protein